MTVSPDPDPAEILSAFMDGESVDPRHLASALSAPDAREILRDFALIRGEVLSDESRPSAAFYKRMDGILATPAGRKRWWSAPVTVPASALAAAAVIVVVLGAWMWRITSSTPARPAEQPPAPDRIVELQPDVDWQSRTSSPTELRQEKPR